MNAPLRQPLPPSPCVGVCEIDAAGLCRGCARTPEEIGWWRDAPEARRAEVWAALPNRSRRAGLLYRRLEWDAEAILDHAEATLRAGRGTWSVEGGPARAGFAPRDAEVERDADTLTAAADGLAFRLRVERFVRAFEAADGRLMLVLPVGRAEAARAALRASPDGAEGPIARVEVVARSPLAKTLSTAGGGEAGASTSTAAAEDADAQAARLAPPLPLRERAGVRGLLPSQPHRPPLPELPSAWSLGAVWTP